MKPQIKDIKTSTDKIPDVFLCINFIPTALLEIINGYYEATAKSLLEMEEKLYRKKISSDLFLCIDFIPRALLEIINGYYEATAKSLLETEENLYRKKTIHDYDTPYGTKTELDDFRYHLRATLAAIDNGEPVEIKTLATWNPRHLVDDLSFDDAKEGLKYLIQNGTRTTSMSFFPIHSYRITLEKLLLYYASKDQKEYILRDPDLSAFSEEILTVTKTHSSILFTKKQFDILTAIMSLYDQMSPYKDKRSNLKCYASLLALEDYLKKIINISEKQAPALLSTLIYEYQFNGKNYCVIHINNKYPQAREYLTHLQQKIPHDCLETVNISGLLEGLLFFDKGLSAYWSLRQYPLYFCIILLTAIQYELPISCFPESLIECEGFNLKAFEDPLQALTPLMIGSNQSTGFLNYYINDRDTTFQHPPADLALANLMICMLDLVQAFLPKDARQKAIDCLLLVKCTIGVQKLGVKLKQRKRFCQKSALQFLAQLDEASDKAEKLIEQLKKESFTPLPKPATNLEYRLIGKPSRPVRPDPDSAAEGWSFLH